MNFSIKKFAHLFSRLKGRTNVARLPLLGAKLPAETFIFTEIYGCGKIGKIALESAFMHHPNTNIHVFGTPSDFEWIQKRPTFIYHDISAERQILENFNHGHLGTASLWAKLIIERPEKYIVHFDSDVIFRGEIFSEIMEKLHAGYSIVGPVRNYQHNPNHCDEVRYLTDLSQTVCFGFDREKIRRWEYSVLTRMCQGAYNPAGHPVIDFFDPVMFDIVRNGGKIFYLDQDDVGGCDKYGQRVNRYAALNELIDFGDKLAHFSSVGSGMYYYLNPEKVVNNVPDTYLQYAKEKYAIFCKVFYQEDIAVEYDQTKYQPLLEVRDWYNLRK